MQEFLELLNNNIAYIVGIPAVSTTFALVARWGVARLTNTILPWIENIVTRLIGQFFGAEAAEQVNELPIVNDIKTMLTMNIAVAEMELIRLKKETVNPLYSDEERMIFTAMFNSLFAIYKDKISEETKLALSVFSNE